MDSLEELRGKRVVVAGIGGGGDALGALVFYHKLKAMGAEPLLASVVWERFVLDPFPGPIPLEQLRNAEPLSSASALVTKDSYVDRFGYLVRPQIVRAAQVLDQKAVFLDLSKGYEGLREAFESLASLGADFILGVDVGGDVIAKGCEDDLWSPLADAVSLSALRHSSLPSAVVVFSPGADGELSPTAVLERVSKIAGKGGLVGAYGLNRREYRALKPYLEAFVSEASKIPFEAFSGRRGEKRIRGGTRGVELSPLATVAFVLDTAIAYEENELAKLVQGTRKITEARERLNRRCVYTELDLEEDLYRVKQSESPLSLHELKGEGRRRLLLSGCSPLLC